MDKIWTEFQIQYNEKNNNRIEDIYLLRYLLFNPEERGEIFSPKLRITFQTDYKT
jgi:hypothetical protein